MNVNFGLDYSNMKQKYVDFYDQLTESEKIEFNHSYLEIMKDMDELCSEYNDIVCERNYKTQKKQIIKEMKQNIKDDKLSIDEFIKLVNSWSLRPDEMADFLK